MQEKKRFNGFEKKVLDKGWPGTYNSVRLVIMGTF
jgi:hypothetical protein